MTRVAAWILAAIGALACVGWVTVHATLDASRPGALWFVSPLFNGVLTCLAVLSAGVWTFARAPESAPRAARLIGLGAIGAGAAVSAATFLVPPAWLSPVWLQQLTLRSVDAIVHVLYDDAVSDLSIARVGTSRFTVRVLTSCSGVESLTLGAALSTLYLWLARARLRFPRALWLPPLLLLSLYAVNVARIVMLIAYGRYASSAALDAFHSSIGWLLFATVVGVGIPAAEALLGLTKTGEDHVDARSNPASAFLIPFIATLGAHTVLALLDASAGPWAAARYAVGAAAVWATRPPRRIWTGARSPVAIGLGVLTAIAYAVALPHTADAPATPLASQLVHVLGYSLITPLVEELAFRGYLLRALSSPRFTSVDWRTVGPGPLIASSIAFGLLHGDVGLASLAGLAFGLAARWSGGLGGAIVAHVVANGLLAAMAIGLGAPGLMR
jgi:exosortase E/protease (VPEID-CTERM system)